MKSDLQSVYFYVKKSVSAELHVLDLKHARSFHPWPSHELRVWLKGQFPDPSKHGAPRKRESDPVDPWKNLDPSISTKRQM